MPLQWTPLNCPAKEETNVLRFGHTCTAVDACSSWGTELAVLFGGVSTAPSADAVEPVQHTALNSTCVLACGGGTWFSPKISGGKLPDARAFHAAAAVNQKVFVFGGHVLVDHGGKTDEHGQKRHRKFFQDLWCLDTDLWEWTLLPDFGFERPCARDMCTLTSVGGGGLILHGGRGDAGRCVNDTWLFDIARCRWTPLKCGGPCPQPRKMHAAVVAGNRLLVVGGDRDAGIPLDDCWSLKLPPDLTQDAVVAQDLRWTPIRVRPAPSGRFGHAMGLIPEGRWVCLFGGCLDVSTSLLSLTRTYGQSAELWLLDLASFSWIKVDHASSQNGAQSEHAERPAPAHPAPGELSPQGRWPTARMAHSVTPLSGGRVLLVGGRRREGICSDAWMLHLPFTSTFELEGLTNGRSERTPEPDEAPASSILQALFNPRKMLSATHPSHTSPDSSHHNPGLAATTAPASAQAQPSQPQPDHAAAAAAAAAPPPPPPQSQPLLSAAAAPAAAPGVQPAAGALVPPSPQQQTGSLVTNIASVAQTPALAAASALASTGLFERFGLRPPQSSNLQQKQQQEVQQQQQQPKQFWQQLMPTLPIQPLNVHHRKHSSLFHLSPLHLSPCESMQPLTPSSLTTPSVQCTPTPPSLPHPGLEALRAKVGLGPLSAKDERMAGSGPHARQEHLRALRDWGWQVQQAAGQQQGEGKHLFQQVEGKLRMQQHEEESKDGTQQQEESKHATLQQEESKHTTQQQEDGSKHNLQGNSAGKPDPSLVQARSQLSKLKFSNITVGEVKLMLQDYLLLAQEKSNAALRGAAAKEENRLRQAQDVVRVLMESREGPSPMSFVHLTGHEGALRMDEIPRLMAEYKTAVAACPAVLV